MIGLYKKLYSLAPVLVLTAAAFVVSRHSNRRRRRVLPIPRRPASTKQLGPRSSSGADAVIVHRPYTDDSVPRLFVRSGDGFEEVRSGADLEAMLLVAAVPL